MFAGARCGNDNYLTAKVLCAIFHPYREGVMVMRFIGLLIAAAVAVWVYMDAKSKGYKTISAVGWMLGVFLLMIVFLPWYLFTRPRQSQVEILTPCKYCGRHYEGSPAYCPNCGHKVEGYSFNGE